MDSLSKFPETLAYLMEEAELNQKQLAKSLNTQPATISHYLKAKYAPSLAGFVALADFFGCSTDFLLGRKAEYARIGFKPCPAFSVQLKEVLKYCKKKGLSGRKLCMNSGISETNLYDWKAGKRKPSLVSVIKLAESLDCPVDYVLGRET